jgi:hypothetical protein
MAEVHRLAGLMKGLPSAPAATRGEQEERHFRHANRAVRRHDGGAGAHRQAVFGRRVEQLPARTRDHELQRDDPSALDLLRPDVPRETQRGSLRTRCGARSRSTPSRSAASGTSSMAHVAPATPVQPTFTTRFRVVRSLPGGMGNPRGKRFSSWRLSRPRKNPRSLEPRGRFLLAATGFGDDLRLPRTVVAHHGVDGDQERARDGGERGLLRLPATDQALVEEPQRHTPARGGLRREKEHAPGIAAATPKSRAGPAAGHSGWASPANAVIRLRSNVPSSRR